MMVPLRSVSSVSGVEVGLKSLVSFHHPCSLERACLHPLFVSLTSVCRLPVNPYRWVLRLGLSVSRILLLEVGCRDHGLGDSNVGRGCLERSSSLEVGSCFGRLANKIVLHSGSLLGMIRSDLRA